MRPEEILSLLQTQQACQVKSGYNGHTDTVCKVEKHYQLRHLLLAAGT